MTIRNNIIESVITTLKGASSLKKYVSNNDIYKGFPTTEQNASLNYIIVEPDVFEITQEMKEGKMVWARAFNYSLIIHAGLTVQRQADILKDFDELQSMIVNAIDSSTTISGNSSIKSFSLESIKEEIYSERILFRHAEIRYNFSAVHQVNAL
jgi:hypothetical protein